MSLYVAEQVTGWIGTVLWCVHLLPFGRVAALLRSITLLKVPTCNALTFDSRATPGVSNSYRKYG